MKKNLFLLLLISVSFTTLYAQNELRTVEITGSASRTFDADFIIYNVNVIQGDRCEIPPSGKNYEKLIKECEKENLKMVASRENILEALISSFGERIKVEGDLPKTSFSDKARMGMYGGGGGSTANLTFRNIADVHDFETKLNDVKGAFSGNIGYGYYSKADDALFEELKLESLTNAKKKAEKMANALGASVDKVLNIYEEKPSTGGYLEMYRMAQYMESMRGRQDTKVNMSAITPEGKVTYSESSYVRFSLK